MAEETTDANVIDVVLTNQYPNIQGFGLDIAGGIDRPFVKEDDGIFVSALRDGGLAQKSGTLEFGDKILAVNGKSVSGCTHEEVVKLFISDRTRVSLSVHKHRLAMLRAAASSPAPKNVPVKQPDSGVSFSGFLLGIVLGCVGVVLIRRYMTASPGKS